MGSNPNEIIELPSTIRKCKDLIELIREVYPQLHRTGTSTAKFLTDRTILSARNDDVNDINVEALKIFPGNVISYLSADKNADDDMRDPIMANRYPVEYLNSLNPAGLPLSDLQLKVGCPVILIRNLAPRDGLCNGTRLRVVRCAQRIIEAEILTGDKAGNLVFIPRISLTPSGSELTIPITRRQFPIRLAFAMTINKSQGQSVKFVGIDLRTPVFTHGQLYVALSRCTTFNRITILLPSEQDTSTTNIVYPEVLL